VPTRPRVVEVQLFGGLSTGDAPSKFGLKVFNVIDQVDVGNDP